MDTLKKLTKAQLVDLVVERNSQVELMRTKIACLEGDVASLKTQLARAANTPRGETPKPRTETRAVYEWDPAVPGDFARANKLARENGGICRRVKP